MTDRTRRVRPVTPRAVLVGLAACGLLTAALANGATHDVTSDAAVPAASAVAATTTGAPVPPTLRAPLATALTTPTGSWAVVAMGHTGQLVNTFWQLLFRAPGASSWRLVTPPGVADNGGLVLSVGSDGAATVGFEPSQQLRYSPLALSTDNGATWAPALVPGSLVAAPDALAVASGNPGGALALVRGSAVRVLARGGRRLQWQPLGGTAISAAGVQQTCSVDAVTAVALGPGAAPLLGTGCRRPGQVGLFAYTGSRWQLIGPSLHGSSARASTRVLRLDAEGATTTALVAEGDGGHGGLGGRGGRSDHGSLLGLWRAAGGGWSVSPPLPLGSAPKMLASAVGANGELVVLLEKPGTNGVLEEAPGPGQAWSSLPSPPAGTLTLAVPGEGSLDAFSVDGTRLRVFTLAAGRATWSLSQSMDVPIAYGSS